MDRNSDIKLFYLANVWSWTNLRTPKNSTDDSKGIFVDVRLHVTGADDEDQQGSFVRMIHMTIADKALEKKIYAKYQELLALQPSGPKPLRSKTRRRQHDT